MKKHNYLAIIMIMIAPQANAYWLSQLPALIPPHRYVESTCDSLLLNPPVSSYTKKCYTVMNRDQEVETGSVYVDSSGNIYTPPPAPTGAEVAANAAGIASNLAKINNNTAAITTNRNNIANNLNKINNNTVNIGVNSQKITNLGESVVNVLGGNAAVDANSNVTMSDIGGTGKNTIHDAVAHVNQGHYATITSSDNGIALGQMNDQIQPGETLTYEAGKNMTLTQSANKIAFALSDNLTKLKSVEVSGIVINQNGINANNKKITNLRDAVNSSDAVNLRQLHGVRDNLNERIGNVEANLSAGIAAASAMELAAYVPGKWTYGAGVANYNGQTAVGATIRKTADNGRWSITAGVAGGTIGEILIRAGITGVLD